MRKFFLLFILFHLITKSYSQEIFCNVQVISPQIEGTDKKIFETLQNSIFDFINNRNWTKYNFKTEEKIECSILLTIEDRVSMDEFRASLNIVLSRPIYQTSYNSPLLNFVDRDIQFRYIEYQPLDFSENAHISELTSILSYYVYMMLGFDFDSYSLHGGTPFFEKAQAIVNNAQNSPYSGWRAFDDPKNRFWLVENCLNPSYLPLRTFSYEYHRKGMDFMQENATIARSIISSKFNLLETVQTNRPGLFLLQVFMESKREELINLYSVGSSSEKSQVIRILSKIDPANSSRYQQLQK